MKIIRHPSRILYINFIILKHALRFKTSYGIRLRMACEELGPIFVKAGQLLSTRVDLLPHEIHNELVKLQDQVPPFCGKQAQRNIEKSLGKPINELYKDFDLKPLASASIAQVHTATMLDGQKVVVKVLRPNIKKQVTRDLDILLMLTKGLQLLIPRARQFKPHAVVLEIKKSMLDELDLMREAANASQLRRNFNNSSMLCVPNIHWSHTKHNVLTLERMYGLSISNQHALVANNINLKCLAERLIEIFFTQAFRDCFFHADMHPGNILIALDNPQQPQCIALDCGIMGTLSPTDQEFLAEIFLAFFRSDYRSIAELHIKCGWVPKHINVAEFESAIRCVCEPAFEKPLKDISFGKILLGLFKTARRFDVQIQPQLILLQKTLVNVEGLSRQLYPELDLWQTIKPFLEKTQRKNINAKFLLRRIKVLGPQWIEKMPELPAMVYKTLQLTAANSQATTVRRPSVWYYFVLGAVSAGFLILLLLRIVND